MPAPAGTDKYTIAELTVGSLVKKSVLETKITCATPGYTAKVTECAKEKDAKVVCEVRPRLATVESKIYS